MKKEWRSAKTAMSTACWAAGVWLLLSWPAVGPVAGDDSTAAPSLSELVERLDSPRYEVRSRATEELIQSGREAIQPLLAAFPKGSLEVRIRAVHILRQLALADDVPTEEAATRALQGLARSSPSVAWRATEVLRWLDLIREDRAIKHLRAVGATIGRLSAPNQIHPTALVIDSTRWRGELADLRQLARIKSITTVKLVGPQVTDEWLHQVARMNQLTTVVLSQTRQVTAAGIAHLARLRQLDELDVFYVPVNDDLIEAIKPILDQIRMLRLYGTQVTAGGADQIRKLLPVQGELDYRRGAFLGVRCDPDSLCLVESVVEGSAAFRAGIRSGDVLIRFDDRPIRTFDDLKASIARCRPGDKAKITLLRGFTEASFFVGSPVTRESLGISVEHHPLGLRITGLKSGKMGARAAMRKGDVLYSVGGVVPESLDQLIATLKKQAQAKGPIVPQRQMPGGGMGGLPFRVINPREILALRGGQQLRVDVSFGRWDQ